MTPHRHLSSRSLLRVDFHAHTSYSLDAVTPPQELVERAWEAGLDRIAVTDHGEIDGALEAQALEPARVIVGEEIRCRCRTELIGLFLSERIPMRLELEEVVERIRDQGGVIYAPHPYAYAWRPLAKARRAIAVADVLEGFNARAFLPIWNAAAQWASHEKQVPHAAGSDAHFGWEVGRAYTEMPYFNCAASFRRGLPDARPIGVRVTHPVAHVASAGLKTARLLTGRRAAVRVARGRRAASAA